MGLHMKGCGTDLRTWWAGHSMSTDDKRHEKVQRAFAARQPPCGGTPPPHEHEWVFFDPALVGVFLFPEKAPPGEPPLKIEFWALASKGCSKDLQTWCGGRFMPPEEKRHEKVQRAFAARQPPCGGIPPPRAGTGIF